MQGNIRADAAFQTIYAGQPVEAEQVGIGELEIEAVLVRIFGELAVADLGCNDDLGHRLDDLRAPFARICA